MLSAFSALTLFVEHWNGICPVKKYHSIPAVSKVLLVNSSGKTTLLCHLLEMLFFSYLNYIASAAEIASYNGYWVCIMGICNSLFRK